MAQRQGSSNAAAGSILLVIHDFIARSPDELSLAKGDRIELFERFLGKHLGNGHSGLFPEVYTTPAPKGTLANNGTTPRFSNGPGRSAQSTVANASPRIASASSTQSLPPPPSTSSVASPTIQQSGIRTSLPSSSPGGSRTFTITSDSPVMSETLSVIDEHITDIRSSYVNGKKRDTRGSVYSREQPSIRRSYIAGHETDEEERQTHTEEEVMTWTPARVAEYLEDNGVEKAHCEVFLDQEISGEVLLAMDQNSVFIKEFDLGSVGRRLKTWHKIKALHEEIRQSASLRPARSASEYSTLVEGDEDNASSGADAGRTRSSTYGSLPRGLATKRQGDEALPMRSSTMQSTTSHSGASPTIRRENSGMSPLQSMTSMTRQENTYRPSAQGVRNLNHSRRHSSIDSTSTDGASRMGHRKHPSIERGWLPGQSAQTNGRQRHAHTASTDSQYPLGKTSYLHAASPEDVDRGYFSSNEADSRNRRSSVTKRNSVTSRPTQAKDGGEFLDGTFEPVTQGSQMSRMDGVKRIMDMGFGSHRSTTSPTLNNKPAMAAQGPAMPPIVTKLEPNFNQSLSATTASSSKTHDNASDASSEQPTPSPSGMNTGMFSSFHSARAKIPGLRSISDAVTKDEKVMGKPVTSPTRTGSTTPSTENRSMELNKSDKTSRTSTGSGGLMPPPASTKRPRARTKKLTSAYTRGLEIKTPAEQMLTCDYAGWMKKKSSSLMTTWKPRLFILRGRRLSYYYSDDDTEEKGLIDISFHKVLPAHNETLTELHATITGAAGNPSSPTIHTTPTIAEQDLRDHPARQGEDDDGLFIFKLVPPKAGLAKGVSFTKPTVHYFAVKSRQEGRLWMAALMKATIDRDDTGVVTTTYNQKTISLEKARARRERPPGLKDDVRSGLGIGIGISELDDTHSAAGAGAESENGVDGNSSIAPSTNANDTDTDALTQQEREAIAAMATP